METDRYLTTAQAADALGIKRSSVYYYLQSYHDFPRPATVGRTLLFDPDRVSEWRAKHPGRRRTLRSSPGELAS